MSTNDKKTGLKPLMSDEKGSGPAGILSSIPLFRGFDHVAANRLCALLLFLASIRSVAAEPPNIIYVMLDDAGYGDFGEFGSQHVQTPVFDRMCREGTKQPLFGRMCSLYQTFSSPFANTGIPNTKPKKLKNTSPWEKEKIIKTKPA